jgi:hypothetical protein
MLTLGIIVLVVSIVVERYTAMRTGVLTERAGGDVFTGDMRYAWEGGPPKWLSAMALASYVGVFAGVVLIIIALVS